MKLIRFCKNNKIGYGVLEDTKIKVFKGDFYDEQEFTNEVIELNECKVLPPVMPSKIVAVGLNYVDHSKELDFELPQEPVVFLKPSSAICGQNDDIIIPNMSSHVGFEAEIAFVIKKKAKNVKQCDYKDYILGYTCLNDVTARDIQTSGGQWARAKSFDTFAPIGPVIQTEILDLDNIRIQSILNDKIMQNDTTSNMLFKFPFLLEYISSTMTLNVGDIVTTGTPSGVGEIVDGDTITIKISGIGELTNHAKSEE